MAALTAARDTRQLSDLVLPKLWRVPVAAGVKLFPGAIAVIRAGYARPATVATGDIVAGRVRFLADNTGGVDGAILAELERGCFGLKNSTSTDEITQVEVGTTCYLVDDQTVAKTSGSSTRSVAGKVFQLEDGLVWVEIAA